MIIDFPFLFPFIHFLCENRTPFGGERAFLINYLHMDELSLRKVEIDSAKSSEKLGGNEQAFSHALTIELTDCFSDW